MSFECEGADMPIAASPASDAAIVVSGLSKCYHVYETPGDRLKQFVLPKLRRAFGLPPRCYYKEFWALRDASFSIRRGEVVGIVGRNGSGKSTLLQLICGTLSPTVGSVAVNGRVAALLELGAGFNPEFSGRENIYLNAAILGMSRGEVNERIGGIIDFADIGDFLDQPVKTYSSGMVVRLAFAVAISVDPDILIVDEALAVGDELFQRKCFARIQAIKAAGATILFVSHSGATILELCDRAFLLDGGELLAQGDPKSVIAAYHKVLYAGKAAADVRERLRQGRLFDSGVASGNGTASPAAPDSGPEAPVPGEFFDPNLIPASTLVYVSHGATIVEPRLTTLAGRPINGLVRGRRYRYTYTVRFDRDAYDVRFGMLVKSVTGLPLAGNLSAPDQVRAIPAVAEGAVLKVEFEFECRFNTGVYFMNAGVFGRTDGDEQLLHRIADAVAFRVMPEEENRVTEFFDIDAVPRVMVGD